MPRKTNEQEADDYAMLIKSFLNECSIRMRDCVHTVITCQEIIKENNRQYQYHRRRFRRASKEFNSWNAKRQKARQ